MKRLYYIRHGKSLANELGVYSGRSDHPLTKEGERQAKLAGKKAKGIKIDAIVSSPQRRALHTAKIIAKEIGYPPKKIMVNSLLVERDFGELENAKHSMSTEELHKAGVKGFETDEELIKRAEEAFAWIDSLSYDNILVAGHGSFGRALRKVIKTEHDFSERIPNAELVCWIEDHESR